MGEVGFEHDGVCAKKIDVLRERRPLEPERCREVAAVDLAGHHALPEVPLVLSLDVLMPLKVHGLQEERQPADAGFPGNNLQPGMSQRYAAVDEVGDQPGVAEERVGGVCG